MDDKADVEVICGGCYGSGSLFQPGDCSLCNGTGKEKFAWWVMERCYKCGGKFANESQMLRLETPNTLRYYHDKPDMCIIVLSFEVGRWKGLAEQYGYKEVVK